jgi:hypothetical protein
MSRCDRIVHQIVEGEPLSAADRRHLESCPCCRDIARLPQRIESALSSRRESARPRAAADALAAAEAAERRGRQRRAALLSAGCAAAAIGILALLPRDAGTLLPTVPPPPAPAPEAPEPAGPSAERGPEAVTLSADWDWIVAPRATGLPLARPRGNARITHLERLVALRADIQRSSVSLRAELEKGDPDAAAVDAHLERLGALELELRRATIAGPTSPSPAPRRRPARPAGCDEVACLVDDRRPCCKEARRSRPAGAAAMGCDALGCRRDPDQPCCGAVLAEEARGRAKVKQIFAGLRPRLEACGADAGVKGDFNVRIQIGEGGAPTSVTSNISEASVDPCLQRIVEPVRFPAAMAMRAFTFGLRVR